MSTDNRRCFVVPESSPVAASWKLAIEKQEAFQAAMLALRDEFGATDCLSFCHTRFCGLMFSGKPPDGWRKKANHDYFIPDLKSKSGKAIKARIAAIPHGAMDGWELSRIIGFSHWASGTVYFPVVEEFDGTLVLSIHEDVEDVPPGCTELKRSEYWALRESAGKEQAV